MRLSLLGGGGFRVPLVYSALAEGGRSGGLIDELTLHDTDRRRLDVVASVIDQLPPGPRVRTTTDLDEALAGADFVFSAIRVGGTEGRVGDERLPLAEGLLGQETVGPGGILYGLRTVPVARAVAERVRALAPRAWVVNFTNPAGLVTEAMAEVLGDRVIGICDSPVGLVRRAAAAAGVPAGEVGYDYLGLNHLGWLRSLRWRGEELLPGLLASDEALASFEEGRLFGGELLRALGSLPNEYLHYYYFARETLEAVRTAQETRGEFLRRQQEEFFAGAAADPQRALELWQRVRREREETYLADSRAAGGGWERGASDLEGGGYEQVALSLMRALAGADPSPAPPRLILNVAGRGAIPSLPDDAVVETVCAVDTEGAHPLPVAPLGGAELGLVGQVKAAERATVAAARSGEWNAALRALVAHPLVDSAAAAGRMLRAAGWQDDSGDGS
ncbi:6-phospho-beta-glucosidase [Streptomyces sp. XM4193]|uniref:family 4 glycosyl hydrolase n=1 Tax=Streptomyces sp. XM4193 TaxID=2929782 RepID=UPI001FF97135|nr:6-phospho-beta-glucosidase [Streptomyces sp. XM4193]MCK1795897.1 6-phospho-beta-glucosidase [Streptomyces sp. XM4193]